MSLVHLPFCAIHPRKVFAFLFTLLLERLDRCRAFCALYPPALSLREGRNDSGEWVSAPTAINTVALFFLCALYPRKVFAFFTTKPLELTKALLHISSRPSLCLEFASKQTPIC
jgi:hypothetical protein